MKKKSNLLIQLILLCILIADISSITNVKATSGTYKIELNTVYTLKNINKNNGQITYLGWSYSSNSPEGIPQGNLVRYYCNNASYSPKYNYVNIHLKTQEQLDDMVASGNWTQSTETIANRSISVLKGWDSSHIDGLVGITYQWWDLATGIRVKEIYNNGTIVRVLVRWDSDDVNLAIDCNNDGTLDYSSDGSSNFKADGYPGIFITLIFCAMIALQLIAIRRIRRRV